MVEGPRGAIREGRVALVATGAAAFAGIAVNALDIYCFDFVTSAFLSFAGQMGSYDGNLGHLATGSLGGTPLAPATALANVAPTLPTVMQADGDPQQRQALFDKLIQALCIGLRREPLAVTLDRLTGPGGTFGLLLQLTEPISLTRDVAVTMTRHIRKWVPGLPPLPSPALPPGGIIVAPRPMQMIDAVHAAALAPSAGPSRIAEFDPSKLPDITFAQDGIRLPAGASLSSTDRIVRIVSGASGPSIEIYAAVEGSSQGRLVQTVSPEQLAVRPDLAAVAKLPLGSIGVIGSGGWLGFGHWEDSDIPVPLVALANGAETAGLLLSPGAAALPAGSYTLHFTLDRDRWTATAAGDPEQHYHDSWTVSLSW
jgi:hypothetical protein